MKTECKHSGIVLLKNTDISKAQRAIRKNKWVIE